MWVIEYRGRHGKFRKQVWGDGREPFPIGWVRVRETQLNDNEHTIVRLEYSQAGNRKRHSVTVIAEGARDFFVREV